jgi:hypothetical protein
MLTRPVRIDSGSSIVLLLPDQAQRPSPLHSRATSALIPLVSLLSFVSSGVPSFSVHRPRELPERQAAALRCSFNPSGPSPSAARNPARAPADQRTAAAQLAGRPRTIETIGLSSSSCRHGCSRHRCGQRRPARPLELLGAGEARSPRPRTHRQTSHVSPYPSSPNHHAFACA